MNPADHLAELFVRLPGIGPKQAKRFVYFLLRADSRYKEDLIRTIDALKLSGKQCEDCFRFFGEARAKEELKCSICRDESRNKSIVMVVEKELDVDAIEKTSSYTGVYFVLGGIIPLLSDKPSDHIRIRELTALLYRKIQEVGLSELIFALPVTDLGDGTREYIEKTVKQIVGIDKVIISTLARGLSSGLELEYVDKDTFKSAFERRQ